MFLLLSLCFFLATYGNFVFVFHLSHCLLLSCQFFLLFPPPQKKTIFLQLSVEVVHMFPSTPSNHSVIQVLPFSSVSLSLSKNINICKWKEITLFPNQFMLSLLSDMFFPQHSSLICLCLFAFMCFALFSDCPDPIRFLLIS